MLLAVAASTTTPMAGMAGASATAAATTAPAVSLEATAAGLTVGALGDVVRDAALPVAAVVSPPMSEMCETVCVTGVSEACMVAVGLAVMTLLALLLASHRDTYLGLLARTGPRSVPLQGRRHKAWTVLSPISLCVLRV